MLSRTIYNVISQHQDAFAQRPLCYRAASTMLSRSVHNAISQRHNAISQHIQCCLAAHIMLPRSTYKVTSHGLGCVLHGPERLVQRTQCSLTAPQCDVTHYGMFACTAWDVCSHTLQCSLADTGVWRVRHTMLRVRHIMHRVENSTCRVPLKTWSFAVQGAPCRCAEYGRCAPEAAASPRGWPNPGRKNSVLFSKCTVQQTRIIGRTHEEEAS